MAAATPGLVRQTVYSLDLALPQLAALDVRIIVTAIDSVVRSWREPMNPYRLALLRRGPSLTRYSETALRYAIDAMLQRFDAAGLERLLGEELGDARALDRFVEIGRTMRRARGPGRQFHVLAGSVPTVGIFSIICALLVKSPVLVKPSSHDPIFPALFAQALAEFEPRLANALAVLPWPGGDESLEAEAMKGVGAVVAYGSDATIADLRRRAPATARFIGYGNKLSVAAIAREALEPDESIMTAGLLAWDVGLFDQQGCLSPQVVFLESGGERTSVQFGELLAERLDELQANLPIGTFEAREAAAVQDARSRTQFRAGVRSDVHIWQSRTGVDWTVILDPEFDPTLLVKNRTAVLVPVSLLDEDLPALLRQLPLSTIGVAAPNERMPALAAAFASIASRICPLGTMGEPPVTWRHDGRPNVGDMVTWVDWERG